ncbi:MAG: hypothetical protein WCO45_17660, partial [Pseudanabaena sp. ELA607]
ITANAQTIMATHVDHSLHIIDFLSGKKLGKLSLEPRSFSFCGDYFSQDREIVAGMDYSSSNGLIRVWELSTGKIMWTFKFPGVRCISLSLDGKLLVAGSTDHKGGVIKIWDLHQGQEILSQSVYQYTPRAYSPYLDGDTDREHGVNNISISPDNSTIVYTISNQGIKILHLNGETKQPLLFGAKHIGDFSVKNPCFISTQHELVIYGAMPKSYDIPKLDQFSDRFRVRIVPMSENGQLCAQQFGGKNYLSLGVNDLNTGKFMEIERNQWN